MRDVYGDCVQNIVIVNCPELFIRMIRQKHNIDQHFSYCDTILVVWVKYPHYGNI